jgi:uncharacterized protein YyaL (SSP411 family)
MRTFSTSRPRSKCKGIIAVLLAGWGAAVLSGRAAEQLRGEPSAFLQAHVDSPVDWMPWGEPVFARAKREKKPVFLVIGAFASELSRAMRQQTFANAETAGLLNQNYICVLVDRDEHPEVAALYQSYVGQVKQLSGWPLNLWLTPELQPFEGATYLPPSEEWGKASFAKFAGQALAAWVADPAGCRTRAAEAVAQLTPAAPPLAAGPTQRGKLKEQLAAAAEAWRARFDAVHGGFSEPPKHPEPELLRFLLRQSPADREAALVTLRALAGSALRDPLDGGFFRYGTDAAWRLPYPQKILTDQARLALAFLDAAQGEDAKAFAAVARDALQFALTRLARPDGTFAAGEDATADEFSGYYAWTAAEIDAALGPKAADFKSAHGVESAGNVTADDDPSGHLKGRNLLRSVLAIEIGMDGAAARLKAVRDQRPAPPRDNRATAGAHGLLLAALARAGGPAGETRWLDAATRTFEAIRKTFVLSSDGDLRRLSGSPLPAGPADYAAVAFGCREFACAAHRADADALATQLLARANQLFFDVASGRYCATPAKLPPGIFTRPLAMGDVPSAESLALLAGVPPKEAQAAAAALSALLDDANTPAPGDVLLALALLP